MIRPAKPALHTIERARAQQALVPHLEKSRPYMDWYRARNEGVTILDGYATLAETSQHIGARRQSMPSPTSLDYYFKHNPDLGSALVGMTTGTGISLLCATGLDALGIDAVFPSTLVGTLSAVGLTVKLSGSRIASAFAACGTGLASLSAAIGFGELVVPGISIDLEPLRITSLGTLAGFFIASLPGFHMSGKKDATLMRELSPLCEAYTYALEPMSNNDLMVEFFNNHPAELGALADHI